MQNPEVSRPSSRHSVGVSKHPIQSPSICSYCPPEHNPMTHQRPAETAAGISEPKVSACDAMMERVEDLELLELVAARHEEPSVKVAINDL